MFTTANPETREEEGKKHEVLKTAFGSHIFLDFDLFAQKQGTKPPCFSLDPLLVFHRFNSYSIRNPRV